MLDKPFQIRGFEEQYLDQVVHINWTCLPENYGSYFFMDLYKRFPKAFLIALAEGKVVGYIMCRAETGFSEFGGLRVVRKGHIVSLAVLPEFRRMGIGRALLEGALNGVLEYGVKECYLEVRVSNESAIRLYESFGFGAVTRLRGYYRDGEEALVMCKRF